MAYSEKNKNNQFGLDDNFFFNARLTETNGRTRPVDEDFVEFLRKGTN